MNYRPEIDGLRALALLPVILFHAGFGAFGGGFVGVDIFFVISGYLITSIIITEKQSNAFTLRGFYSRRVRRILPALYFVLSISSFACLFVLSPFDGRDFWQSLSATILFASNILFVYESSDYFGLAAEYKPLLHTWSLAVEEQYYVLYPLVLLAAWRFGMKWMAAMLVAAAIMSLAAAQWAAYNSPANGFFLLPTRGWELLIGAFITFYFNKNKACPADIPRRKMLYEVGGAVGLMMIGFAVLLFDESTPFPSLFALIPVIGAALVILFTNPQTLVGRLLANKFFVGIGLISYSAYLWHQPLFAFARYYVLSDLSVMQSVVVIVFTFVLAGVSWKFIEQPCRRKSAVSNGVLFSMLAAVSLALFSMGMAGHVSKGYQDIKLSFLDGYKKDYFVDFFSEAARKEEVWRVVNQHNTAVFNNDTRRKILILGDSLSGDFFLAARLNARLSENNDFVRQDLDDPLMGAFLDYLMKPGAVALGPRSKFIELEKLVAESDEIVLAANWSGATAPLALKLAEHLAEDNKKIYVVDAFRVFHMSASSFDFANSDLSSHNVSQFMYKRLSTDYLAVRKYLNDYFHGNDSGIKLIYKAEMFCDFSGATCDLYSGNGRPLIFDELHLTVEGVKYFGDRLEKAGYFSR